MTWKIVGSVVAGLLVLGLLVVLAGAALISDDGWDDDAGKGE